MKSPHYFDPAEDQNRTFRGLSYGTAQSLCRGKVLGVSRDHITWSPGHAHHKMSLMIALFGLMFPENGNSNPQIWPWSDANQTNTHTNHLSLTDDFVYSSLNSTLVWFHCILLMTLWMAESLCPFQSIPDIFMRGIFSHLRLHYFHSIIYSPIYVLHRVVCYLHSKMNIRSRLWSSENFTS